MRAYSLCERCGRHVRYSYSLKKFVLLAETGSEFKIIDADCAGEDHRADWRHLVQIDIPFRRRIP